MDNMNQGRAERQVTVNERINAIVVIACATVFIVLAIWGWIRDCGFFA